jgi:hypothetical protein
MFARGIHRHCPLMASRGASIAHTPTPSTRGRDAQGECAKCAAAGALAAVHIAASGVNNRRSSRFPCPSGDHSLMLATISPDLSRNMSPAIQIESSGRGYRPPAIARDLRGLELLGCLGPRPSIHPCDHAGPTWESKPCVPGVYLPRCLTSPPGCILGSGWNSTTHGSSAASNMEWATWHFPRRISLAAFS